MKEFIKWLKFQFHIHEWENINEVNVFRDKEHQEIVGERIIQKCKICDKYRVEKINLV